MENWSYLVEIGWKKVVYLVAVVEFINFGEVDLGRTQANTFGKVL